jgi:gas vesicle protein
MSNEQNCCQHSGGFFKGILFGAIIGGIAGVLLAPDKGEKTRKVLKQKAEELKNKANELSNEMQDSENGIPDVISEKIEQVADFLQQKKDDLMDVVEKEMEMKPEKAIHDDAKNAPLAQIKRRPLKRGVKSFYKKISRKKAA